MYVLRDAKSNILAWAETPTDDRFTEEVPNDDPALLAEMARRDSEQALRIANAPILAQLAANDAKVVRALTEGDSTRIDAHKAAQAALRVQLMK